MITLKKQCPVCKTEFIYMDLRNPPETCGSKICRINMKYRKNTRNLQTGEYQSFDKIGHL